MGQPKQKHKWGTSWKRGRMITRFLLPHRGRLLGAFLFLLISSALTLFLPALTSDLINGTLRELGLELALPDHWLQQIDRSSLVIATCMVFILLFTYLEMSWFGQVGESAVVKMRRDAFTHLLRLPMAYFDAHRIGEIQSRLSHDIAQVQEFWVHDLRHGVRYSLLVLGSCVMMALTSPSLSIVLAIVLPLAVSSALLWGRKVRHVSTRAQDELASSSGVVQEALTGIVSVKAYGRELWEEARLDRSLQAFLRHAITGTRWRSLLVVTVLGIIFSGFIFLMWWGSRQIAAGKLSPGEFFAFMFYLMFASMAAATLGEIFSRLQRSWGAVQRMIDLFLENPEEISPPALDQEKAKHPTKASGRLTFREVAFSYPSRTQNKAIDSISFQLETGQCLAIVGANGAGKSTLFSLALGLYHPQEGAILLDDTRLGDTTLFWWRHQFGLVPQELILFGGTIRENIAYGNLEATENEIWAAIDRAHARPFIEKLPEQLDTLVGERGAALSGGQRQRIALARAILRDPPILLLDEATSALDAESEPLIQEAIEDFRHERTTLVIAHRWNSIRAADQLLILEEGRIAASGSPRDLASHPFIETLRREQPAANTP